MSTDLNSAQPGIRFNDCLFTEPVSLAAWTPPKYAGLLAILVKDPNWAPKAFQPLYFAEFGNNAPLPALLRDYPRFVAAAKGMTLYVSVLPIPFSTTSQRCELRNQLIWAYNPECQTEGNVIPQGELASKLSDLEKKHREQIAQMLSLLGNPPVQGPSPEAEAPSEARRRRFGFMPHAEPAAG